MKSSQQFWDKAAPRYAKSPIRDEKTYQKKLAVTQGYFHPDWQVLEFGCGTGSTAIIHAPHVEHILATDVSSKMLEIAEQKARDAHVSNVSFRQGTLETLELATESFDAVLGLNILHLLEDVESAIVRVGEVLKPGGIFVSSSALIADLKVHWRILIPIMQRLNLAPPVSRFNKTGLINLLTTAGFSIEYVWQPKRDSVFIIARKK
ncbi:hypothetical protein RE428_12950 [Marinobacter nanhaiticus D15-8W]|uniref:Class I SAM-dependent methyltransferase n=1 Tax=Marinobacter nanhaiticus D15-8W TaxID=626887 RepID=N6WN45_9GAMM|nr:class I SAM-dependent methyltransferase [Marinobacter nanhaiticus]ENO12926.1 class I SAM-dependent methyltransferase [Marinobacter nanhaiticus D15-8W]BES70277.1 hypothetical protein RE428_12950 [Marinobacter nanhaiticus D15-8W]